MSVVRGRPPALASGNNGSTSFHCSSVRSVGYGFLSIPVFYGETALGTASYSANRLIGKHYSNWRELGKLRFSTRTSAHRSPGRAVDSTKASQRWVRAITCNWPESSRPRHNFAFINLSLNLPQSHRRFSRHRPFNRSPSFVQFPNPLPSMPYVPFPE